ncbi:MAG: hypothetical protein KGN76_09740 [Acidobacteriota bacterium]|nr:hypothetical protein [Acidobacteriota bacterium]
MQTKRWRMVAACALALGVAAALAGCRRQTVWSGIQMDPDAGTMKLAAEEPLCGCTTVANVTKDKLRLRSEFRGSTVGSATLEPGERLRFRFDWAGPENDDVYVLQGTDAQGHPVNLSQALRVEERPRWQDCNQIGCTYGTLQMNLGETAR